MTECDLQMVGEEFGGKPYAMAVQQGSPLKDKLNDVYVNSTSQPDLIFKNQRFPVL